MWYVCVCGECVCGVCVCVWCVWECVCVFVGVCGVCVCGECICGVYMVCVTPTPTPTSVKITEYEVSDRWQADETKRSVTSLRDVIAYVYKRVPHNFKKRLLASSCLSVSLDIPLLLVPSSS